MTQEREQQREQAMEDADSEEMVDEPINTDGEDMDMPAGDDENDEDDLPAE